MQFQITCKHCGKPFGIEAQQGQTVRCNCPFCGQSAVVATPMAEVSGRQDAPLDVRRQPAVQSARPDGWSLGRKVTVVFVVVLLSLIALSAFLYVIFSAMSN